MGYFYPRSPCGERHSVRPGTRRRDVISIHALLAESDNDAKRQTYRLNGFLSTLSLRRATVVDVRRATGTAISIHALLAESDSWAARARVAQY